MSKENGSNVEGNMDESKHRVAVQRLMRVFTFLKALHVHRNPVVRDVAEYGWRLRYADLPHHPLVVRSDISDVSSEDPLASTEESFLLKVARPQETQPPSIPVILDGWLIGRLTDLSVSPEVSKFRPRPLQHDVLDAFDDDPARVSAWNVWRTAWEAWATRERPVRETLKLFNRLFELHQRFEREGEGFELVLGDGALRWKPGPVLNHPILLQRVRMEFDPDGPQFTILAADQPVEFYLSLFQDTPAEPSVVRRAQDVVTSGTVHPLGGDDTTGFLRRFVAELHPGGRLAKVEERTSDDAPIIIRDPILFVRSRALGFGAFLQAALDALGDPEQAEVPSSLSRIVGIVPPLAVDDSVDLNPWEEPEDVLLSKAANPEQIRVARQLNRGADVLVQGPPGTGKTHTIANLLGHLLAQGKSVLVTSHTTKALRVLRDKVVEPLQPLCVSVLDSERGSQAQLEQSITEIVRRLSTSDIGTLRREASDAVEARQVLLGKLQDAHRRLADARRDEYRAIVVAGIATEPLDAARGVALGRGKDDWIPAPVRLGDPLPLSIQEIVALYRTNMLVSQDDEREIDLSLPDPSQLPTPEQYTTLVQQAATLRAVVAEVNHVGWTVAPSHEDEPAVTTLLQETRDILREVLTVSGWELAALDAGIRGAAGVAPWRELADEIVGAAVEAQNAENALLRADVVLPEGDPRAYVTTIKAILAGLNSHDRLGQMALLFKPIWRRFVNESKVDGDRPNRREHFELLYSAAKLRLLRQQIVARWNRQATPHGETSGAELGEAPERAATMIIGRLSTRVEWYQERWLPVERRLRKLGFAWDQFYGDRPIEPGPHGDCVRLRRCLNEALIPSLEWRAAACRLHRVETELTHVQTVVNTSGISDVAETLRLAVQSGDLNTYAKAHHRLTDLVLRAEHARERRHLLAKLCDAAPGWAAAITSRQGLHGEAAPPNDADAAWMWRQFHDELSRRHRTSLEDLQKTVETLTDQLRDMTARTIELQAWAGQVERTTAEQQQALMGYRSTKRRIGKGTGRYALQYQAEARRLMGECRGAVPVWIMPLSQVVQTFQPTEGRFDVVIIDEASQCDVLGLAAFFLAKQVLVVGDDEQVSPDAVGQRLDVVQRLIQTHLDDVPNAHLYDGQMSVYDLAQQSFPSTIRLVEHFRCVPDIIEFSNHLSYHGEIKPLRDASLVSLRPHTVAHCVAGGLADDSKINQVEAIEVASLLIAAIEQPAYAAATFGVISLLGDEQARLIESLLRPRLPVDEWERRRILCGNAAQFQGDERTVMFLSMVKSGIGDGPLSAMGDGPLGRYKKRFNVAASRAQDQMWIVHSLDPDTDLKPEDLRLRLIRHAEDPQALSERLVRAESKTESEFERLVLRHLMQRGYRVTPQWWAGRYRIDLVVHGEGNKRVAVELDGEQWHQDIMADMGRQAMLERVSWKFIRIRGSQFFADQAGTLRDLEARLALREINPWLESWDKVDSAGHSGITDDGLQERVVRRAAELRRRWLDKPSEDMPEEIAVSAFS